MHQIKKQDGAATRNSGTKTMKTNKTCNFEVFDTTMNTIVSGSFLVWSDDNHPALLRGDLQHKAKQLAETFWNGKDTTCRIMTLSGCITYTHSEE